MARTARCGVPCLGLAGITLAAVAMVGSMLLFGAWSWQAYLTYNHSNNNNNNNNNNNTEADDTEQELRTRAMVGVAEGFFGTLFSSILIRGFLMYNVVLMVLWGTWCWGFCGYNGYCVYRYYVLLQAQVGPSLSLSMLMQFDAGWSLLLCAAGLLFELSCGLIFLVVAAKFVYKMQKGEFDVYSFKEHVNDDVFEMT